MTKKIFRSTVAVGLAVLAASLVIIMGALYSYFGKLQEQQLKDELSIAAAAMAEGDGMSYLTRLDSDNYRITWLRADGVVLYDTRADAATMENHAQREEVRQALANGAGESSRYSNTMLTKMLYYAQRLPDGTVLRLSASRVTAGAVLLGMLQPILLVIAAALILSGLLASRVSKRIVEPLNRLDLEHPLENEAYEELSPLLRRLEHQRRQIDQQMSALRRRSEEFEQITASMTEGLVLLDNSGTVLSINPAAQAVLGTDSACVGQPLVAVERDTAVSRALRDAMENGRAETCMEKDGREYQFDMTRIQADGETVGAVLLTFDVTEQTFAQRNRREFTANVSHELKTPLHAISGYAELMKDGLVPPEDTRHFGKKIYSEAQRMIDLVEDTLRLSRLDEGAADMQWAPIDLYETAKAAMQELTAPAELKNVSIRLEGTKTVIHGIPQLVSGIVFNLMDNAVKYNKDGGLVIVRLGQEKNQAVLTVTDTGIGIRPEHQERVFERFYRVDKSHSKEIGGTGLGLSIVKHAALILGAAIELDSTVGKGTIVTVRFPMEKK